MVIPQRSATELKHEEVLGRMSWHRSYSTGRGLAIRVEASHLIEAEEPELLHECATSEQVRTAERLGRCLGLAESEGTADRSGCAELLRRVQA